MRIALLPGCLAVVALSVAGSAPNPGTPATDESTSVLAPPIPRSNLAPDSLDPVARLAARIGSGDLHLDYVERWGYLPALLDALEVPVSSQALVFSRTSLQTDRIAPWAPRALYFNDDVYVGWVQDSPIIEIASVDPIEGARFYTLSQTDPSEPRFTTESTTCLMCHESRSVTGGVPGFMVRSMLVDRMGYPIGEIHPGPTTDRTPFEKRWGGWYVTGTHEAPRHSGNVHAPDMSHEVADKDRYLAGLDFGAGANVRALADRFDVDAYLSPHSDLVAILVLTHQTQVHNLIALVREETRAALRLQDLAGPASEEGLDEDGLLPTTRMRITGPVERLLRTMLFAREAPLGGPVRGTSSFAEDFEAWGIRDGEGRSLRDLDLDARLFRYPLSFLIHRDAFASLPEVSQRMFVQRLASVLAGEDPGGEFRHLDEVDRRAIREIVAATEPELWEMAGAVEPGASGEGRASGSVPAP